MGEVTIGPDRVVQSPALEGARLLGREIELQVLREFVRTLKAGSSGTLVVCGEPGIGKTTLLRRFLGESRDIRIESCTGVESEMELSWAGLHQLCSPMLDAIDRIPGPQRSALQTAFGLIDGNAPDPFRVGLGVLSLFAEIAEREPLICVIDDFYALDIASVRTLAFVGRRLQTESVGLIFGTRVPSADIAGFPSLRVPALSLSDARRLLDTVTFAPLDPVVRERILAEAGGNPLAIIELGQARYVEQLAGGYEIPATMDPRSHVEQRFMENVTALSAEHRTLLLLAAAEPTGDPELLNRAAVAAGIQIPDREHQAFRGLISFAPRVQFRHPLLRSAIYESATEHDRRAAHHALASATHEHGDPDRRVWHLARSLDRQDEGVAEQLMQSAAKARVRGGFPGAAAFLERAAQLTPEPSTRAKREIEAAGVRIQTREPDAAVQLLNAAEARNLEAPLRAEAELMRGYIALRWGNIDRAPALLLQASESLEPFFPERAREALLEALIASSRSAPLGSRESREAVAGAARKHFLGQSVAASLSDQLAEAFARFVVDGVSAATPSTRAVTRALLEGRVESDSAFASLTVAVNLAMGTFDIDGMTALAELQVDKARQFGALAVLPTASDQLCAARFMRGDVRGAEVLAAEASSIEGPEYLSAPALVLAAWRGEGTRYDALATLFITGGNTLGLGHVILWENVTRAVLQNSRAAHREALEVLTPVVEAEIPMYASLMAFEYAEAAGRAGSREEAARAREYLLSLTASADTGWSRGQNAISTALLCESEAADTEACYRRAFEEFSEVGMVIYAARTRLLFGEWLHHSGRTPESRVELRAAHACLLDLGFTPLAERAARGLGAAARAKRRAASVQDSLTPQERQVAEMAASGLNNREIGERLFLSHRTVGSHLYRIYPKLGIKSRNQLHLVLPPRS